MGSPIIKLVQVQKYYNGRAVIDIPYFEFEENKLHIILGPNGSGKSTLLGIIAGIEKLDGKIYYRNKEIDNKILRKNISLVLQTPYIFNTTVFNNIAYGLKVRGLSRRDIKNKVGEILKRMELEEYKDRKGTELSQGEMRKVAIARALVIDPEVLLLDEPTSDLDRRNIQLIENLLKATKKTIIMATQSTNQAHRLAEILITIKNGLVR